MFKLQRSANNCAQDRSSPPCRRSPSRPGTSCVLWVKFDRLPLLWIVSWAYLSLVIFFFSPYVYVSYRRRTFAFHSSLRRPRTRYYRPHNKFWLVYRRVLWRHSRLRRWYPRIIYIYIFANVRLPIFDRWLSDAFKCMRRRSPEILFIFVILSFFSSSSQLVCYPPFVS